MDQLIASLPKALLAIIILVIALVVMRFVQPPHTICDSQMELFREQQKKFLYAPEAVGGIQKQALIKELMAQCKSDNSPGGCFELFVGLRKIAVDLNTLPDQCGENVAAEKELYSAIWGSLKLMVQMAWGEKPPASYQQNRGWFDTSEISLFCNYRRHAIRFSDFEEFNKWQHELLLTLPQAASMPQEQSWPRSLLSTPCEIYR